MISPHSTIAVLKKNKKELKAVAQIVLDMKDAFLTMRNRVKEDVKDRSVKVVEEVKNYFEKNCPHCTHCKCRTKKGRMEEVAQVIDDMLANE